MNRSGGDGFMQNDPVAAILGNPDKRQAAAQILGQAYVTAYTLMLANQEQIERIADELVERKEIYGDEVTNLLNSVGLQRPEIDLTDDRTWPTV